jgi:hypothetical protein
MQFPIAIRPLLAAAVLLWGAAAWAHPFHVSLAEAEYDRESGVLEVALRVHPADLEEALRKQAGKRIVLDQSADADERIVAYLRRTFAMKTPQGEAAEIRWVGKEVSVKQAWLYFEVPLPGGIENVEVSQRMFFELLPDQVNTVHLRDGERRVTLHFTRAKPRGRLAFPALHP